MFKTVLPYRSKWRNWRLTWWIAWESGKARGFDQANSGKDLWPAETTWCQIQWLPLDRSRWGVKRNATNQSLVWHENRISDLFLKTLNASIFNLAKKLKLLSLFKSELNSDQSRIYHDQPSARRRGQYYCYKV